MSTPEDEFAATADGLQYACQHIFRSVSSFCQPMKIESEPQRRELRDGMERFFSAVTIAIKPGPTPFIFVGAMEHTVSGTVRTHVFISRMMALEIARNLAHAGFGVDPIAKVLEGIEKEEIRDAIAGISTEQAVVTTKRPLHLVPNKH